MLIESRAILVFVGAWVGWRAQFEPDHHPVLSNYEFSVLIGADGRRNSLQGFQHKEFRGKLAIGITCNYVNHHTREEQNFEGLSRESNGIRPLSECLFRNQWRREDLQSTILQRIATTNIDRSREYRLLQE